MTKNQVFKQALRRIKYTSIPTTPLLANAAILPFRDSGFDLLVTDQLLGSSAWEEELALLREISRVGRPNAQVIMKIFAGLGDEGLPIDYGISWRDNALKFGKKDERDRYVGLTLEQWKELGRRYVEFVNNAYFNPLTSFPNFGEIEGLFKKAGFNIEEVIPWGITQQVTEDSIGDFIIRAVKA